ncbi:MAG: hypothetical protein ACKVPX_11985 [Myxococcaceae bacterium]
MKRQFLAPCELRQHRSIGHSNLRSSSLVSEGGNVGRRMLFPTGAVSESSSSCSDAARFITGAVLVCDGGQSLLGSGLLGKAMGAIHRGITAVRILDSGRTFPSELAREIAVYEESIKGLQGLRAQLVAGRAQGTDPFKWLDAQIARASGELAALRKLPPR